MSKLFQHSQDNRFHISVGVVLFNDGGKLCVHKFDRSKVTDNHSYLIGELHQAYTFMRESLEEGESLEGAALRGIKEEFGAVGVIDRYLGSLQQTCVDRYGEWEKTTLYFSVCLVDIGERSPDDPEYISEVIWMTPEELKKSIRPQVQPGMPEHLNEVKILETYMKLYA